MLRNIIVLVNFGRSINQSIIVFSPRAGLSLQTQHSPFYPLLSLPFCICIQSIYHNVVNHLISSSSTNLLPVYLPSRASFSRQVLLSSGPVNFFSSSFSSSTIAFFILSILHAPSFSISTFQMLQVIFAHSITLSKSLHHTTLHSTQNTSLASSLVPYPRVHRKCFSSC